MPFGFLRQNFLGFLQEFFHDSRAIGILLLVCTCTSLIVANTPVGTPVIGWLSNKISWLHDLHLPHSILHFINDGLMSVFFFLVGMEIKRELVAGELSSRKRAILPFAAAAGGMIVPALLYILFNKGTNFQNGWGIPTATDIAFSLGVASIIGKRFPANLKVFLTALAIIDDLGAILVIAFFYGGKISFGYLLAAAAIVFLLAQLNKRHIQFGALHIVLGIALWYLVFNSGIHSTIAGVIFAFMVPIGHLPKLEMKLHNVVNFGILPLFALANTAIVLQGGVMGELWSRLGLGIILGLVIGKPLGIYFACSIMVKQKLAVLPQGIAWRQLWGAGMLAGIGFTMSIFIAGLAFVGSSSIQDIAKIAILIAAAISVIISVLWFKLFAKSQVK